MSAFAGVVALAERELDLVRAAEWELVAEVSAERVRRFAALGGRATPADRPALERLLTLEQQLTTALRSARSATVRELGSLRRGRGAMRGYGRAAAPAAAGRGGWIDHAA